MTINFKENKNINVDQLEKLYNDVEWFAYTNDLPLLQQALS